MNDSEMVTGAVDRQVVQRRKSAEAESRKESTKSNANVDVPPSNPVQETESSVELSRMSIISSDCVAAVSVPVDHRVEAETKVAGPRDYTHSYSLAIRSDLSHI